MMGGDQFDYGQIPPQMRDRLPELEVVIQEGWSGRPAADL